MDGKTIREVVGTSTVVLGLLFVGLEVRQNTAAVRAASLQAVGEMSQANSLAFATSPELGAVLAAALSRPDSMTPQEYLMMAGLVLGGFRTMETRFRLVDMGVLDADELFISGGASALYRSAWVKAWWEEDGRAAHSPDFVEWYDRNVQSLPLYEPPPVLRGSN